MLVLGYDNNAALGRVTDQWDVACPPLHPAWLDSVGPGDGGGGTYKEGYDYCRPDIMMDNLLAEGKIDPMIVVMPDIITLHWQTALKRK